MSIYRQSKTSLIISKNHIFNFFFVSTLSSMGDVLCSAIVSERLKMRKSLGIHYWQDILSGAEVNKNVININKRWKVSTSFVILYYFSLFYFNITFFNSSKIEVSKNLGDCSPSPSPLAHRFLYDFLTKVCLILHSINWPNFIV